MVNVTEKDIEAAERCGRRLTTIEYDLAEYREEIEARVREECAEKTASTRESNAQLILSLAERDKRIAELSDMHRSSSVKLDWLRARNTELDKRIEALEAQLASEKPRMHSDDCDEHLCRLENENARLLRQLEELAAAKPVLTAEEHNTREAIRSGLPHVSPIDTRFLIELADRLCPPPKAPLTDEEIIRLLEEENSAGQTVEANVTLAIKALRARGAK